MGRQCLRIDFYSPKVKVFRWPSEKSYVMHETFVSPDQGLVTQVLCTKFSEPLTPPNPQPHEHPVRFGELGQQTPVSTLPKQESKV